MRTPSTPSPPAAAAAAQIVYNSPPTTRPGGPGTIQARRLGPLVMRPGPRVEVRETAFPTPLEDRGRRRRALTGPGRAGRARR